MREFNRRADWVWRQRGLAPIPFGAANPLVAEETNRYVYFRRNFMLDSDVAAAHVHVSADGRYQLFVNGRFVGRGPARCNPAWQCVDSYDLAPYLQRGRNVIAALAHSYGRHTAWYELPTLEHGRAFGCGGFFFQGDVNGIRLDTGQEWQHLESEAWRRDVPNGSLGFVEIYDARRAPSRWREVDFDDSEWHPPEILRLPGRNGASDVIPFPVMVPRAIPPLHEEIRYAQSLVLFGEVNNAPTAPEIAPLFAKETIGPLLHCQVQAAENLLTPGGVTQIITTADHSVSLVLDFGMTLAGRVYFDVEGPVGATLDFTYSEMLEDDNRVQVHGGIPGFDVPPGHRVTLHKGRQNWEAFEMSGFRYLHVTVRSPQLPGFQNLTGLSTLTLHTVALNFSTYPVRERGRFACSDDLLTHIWQVGANTSRLCMLDGYVDCPSREQRQWMSAYFDTRISFAAFGEPHLAAQLLRQIAHSQQPNGLTMMVAPGDFAVMGFTNIPDFCLNWIMTIGAYVDYIGDMDIIRELYPVVVKAIRWFERHLNEDDLLTDLPHWVFVDWAAVDKRGQVTAVNAQFVAVLREAARLADFIAYPPDAARFTELADRITTVINQHLWDEIRGVYADARKNGQLSRRISQQSNAAAIAFGVAPSERWPRIFATILDQDRLVLTPAGDSDPAPLLFDEETDVVLAQPAYMHFLHQALRMAGKQLHILDNIRQRWGQMLSGGDLTIWETWQATAVLSSRCHAWAATPTFDLSTDVLGVEPISPGFKSLRVSPQPGDLTWAKGAFPTPYGEVEVDWQVANGRFLLKLIIPENTEAEVLLPGWETAVTLGSGQHQLAT